MNFLSKTKTKKPINKFNIAVVISFLKDVIKVLVRLNTEDPDLSNPNNRKELSSALYALKRQCTELEERIKLIV